MAELINFRCVLEGTFKTDDTMRKKSYLVSRSREHLNSQLA